MKQSSIIILLSMLMSMVGITVSAHDIAVENEDGITIYYVWENNKTELAVSFCGPQSYSYSNEYSGKIIIPESVVYNGSTYSVSSIKSNAFSGCNKLVSVIIPNSVTSIEDYAFSKSSLSTIDIPNSITIINKGVFNECSYLKSVTIPKSITKIEQSAFKGCTKLENIDIPNNVISIGGSAFSESAWYNKQPNGVVYAGKVAYKFKGTMPQNTEIILEDGTLGIADFAFSNYGNLISINIPNGVIAIGDNAFASCSNLASINIPNSVISIGNAAFSNCSKISSIIIPNSVKTISWELFQNCINLSSVNLSNSVTDIETDAFNGCTSLKSISLPQSLETIGQRAFSGCKSLSLLELSNSLKTIELAAFNGCSSLNSLTMPESLTTIGASAFGGCTSLSSIFIPSTVTDIGQGAFSGCVNLKEVTIDSDAILSKEYKYGYAFESIFGNQVSNYILGDHVSRIGKYVFKDCIGLTSITIPNSVSTIEYSAFSGCTGLTSISIPNSVTDIGSGVFEGCTNLTSVKLPNSLNSVADAFFKDCKSMSAITIPNSVKAIGWRAFSGCENLEFVTFSNSMEIIGSLVFDGCYNLKDIIIPSPVSIIEYGAFKDCTGLKTVVFPASLTTIGGEAFLNCKGLKQIEIPASIIKIEYDAFKGCTSTESVSFLHNKEELDKLKWSSQSASDFKGPKETCLLFSEDVKSKTDRSYFRYRPDAFSFWMVENSSCFEGINEEGYIEGHFVKMTVGNNPIWLPVNGKVDGDNYSLTGRASFTGYKSIQASLLDGSMEGILDLTEVNSHSDGSGDRYKIISIGFEAFRGMPITQVTLPETLQELGGSSLRETNLKYVVIPNSLTSIGGTVNKTSDQFRGCTNLKTVVLGESVESIGEVVFSKCDNLEMVVSLPMTPPTLDESTFRYSLTTETTFEGHPYGIIVHNDALEKYQNAEYWKDLVYFQSFDTTPVYLKQDNSNLRGTSARLFFYPIDEAHDYGEIPNGEEYLINGLRPNTSQSGLVINWKTKDGNFGTAILDVKTSNFTIETSDAKALSTTKARLLAIADEADDVEHYGFEWRQYDAPEGRPSNKVSAPLYNGRIVGTLNNLNPDKDYKYRPFYKSDSGEMYYGEWMWLYTGDADVYFEPEVYTKDAADITKVSALLAGVWFEGTDDIEEKGFEYWTVSNNKTRTAGSDAKKVIVSSNSNMMTTTLEGLTAGATYGYRSYARTASGTTYGEEKTFRTILVGDVNSDGVLDEKDLKDLADYIMGKTPKGFNKKEADLNNDNKVNAADIVKLVDLLGK